MAKKKTDEEILKEASARADEWLEAVVFDGKADIPKIEAELKKCRHKGLEPIVRVVGSVGDVAKAVWEAAVEAREGNEKDAKKQLSKVSPHLCVWSPYLMAFYESAYLALGKEHGFIQPCLLEAARHGLGFVVNLGGVLVGVTRPEAYRDEESRIHREDGPAIIWGSLKEWWWHGVKVEEKWIEDKDSITKEDFKKIENQELKRAFCEILGWERVLNMVGARKVQGDDWGDLVEAQLDDDEGQPARFADVRCPSTDRRYLIRTDPKVKTCKEALAMSARMEPDEYSFDLET